MNFNYCITTDDFQTSVIWNEKSVDETLELLQECEDLEIELSLLRVYLCYEGQPLMWMPGDKFKVEVSKFNESVFE